MSNRKATIALDEVAHLIRVESGSGGHRAQASARLDERPAHASSANLQVVVSSIDLELLAPAERESVA